MDLGFLKEIHPKLSAEDNIKRRCYQTDGYLFKEYGEIFHDSFGKRAPRYQKIIEKLSTGLFGIDDISLHLGVRPILFYADELGPGIKDSDFFSAIISFELLLTRPVEV